MPYHLLVDVCSAPSFCELQTWPAHGCCCTGKQASARTLSHYTVVLTTYQTMAMEAPNREQARGQAGRKKKEQQQQQGQMGQQQQQAAMAAGGGDGEVIELLSDDEGGDHEQQQPAKRLKVEAPGGGTAAAGGGQGAGVAGAARGAGVGGSKGKQEESSRGGLLFQIMWHR